MDNPKNIPWYMSSSQLEMTIKELEKMNEVRDKNMFFPYYPKGIADCWDSSDELGKKLLEISGRGECGSSSDISVDSEEKD